MNKKDKPIKQKMVITGAFIVGILISIYLKTLDPDKVYITLDEKKEIESNIEDTKKEILRLKSVLKDQEKTLNDYESALEDDDKSPMDLMEEELEHYKMISGYLAVEGAGIVLSISDSDKELQNGQNPNDLLVHDIDILRILNDLKKAGVKAISINGERVLPTSKIKCSGATITVNETTYGQPFVIRAVGNIDMLKAAVISPDSYINLLKEVYGINIQMEENDSMIVNSYEKYT